jgi:HSP20 family protein
MAVLMEPFSSLFDSPTRRLLSSDESIRAFAPPADLVITDDEVTVLMDLPGFKSEDLEIELTDEVLTVRGERRYPYAKEGSEDRTFYRFERGYGRFERILHVPKGLERDAVSASMEDGVLTLHIPKSESRKPRRIEIETGGSGRTIDIGSDGDKSRNGKEA